MKCLYCDKEIIHSNRRNTKGITEWRNEVFKRDDWTCQKSKQRGKYLNAHHIKNFQDYPELRLDVRNGITLSQKEHKEFHKKYGKRKNDEQQLYEFLGFTPNIFLKTDISPKTKVEEVKESNDKNIQSDRKYCSQQCFGKSRIGIEMSIDTRRKISKNNVGFRGMHHTERTKKKIRETSKRIWSNQRLRNKMSMIIQNMNNQKESFKLLTV